MLNLHGKSFLIIEDDQHIYSLIEAMFKPYDVDLTLCEDGNKGLEAALNGNFNLIILDIMLPGKDGWDICREIKNSEINIPIIMLTAKAEEADKVLGLEIGADDYVTKPFSPREFIARIKAVLRRTEINNNSSEYELKFPEINLTIDTQGYQIKVNDENVILAPREFELLNFLASNQNQVFTREQLLDQIWGYNNYAETRTVDEHIKRLRNKLTDAGLKINPLKTVWGVGYKFEIGRDN